MTYFKINFLNWVIFCLTCLIFFVNPLTATGSDLRYSSDISFEYQSLFKSPQRDLDSQSTKWYWNQDFLWKFTDSWRLLLSPHVSGNIQSKDTENRFYMDPKESYFQWSRESWSFSLGYLGLKWGIQDAYNPGDIQRPLDLRDPLHQKSRGLPGISTSYQSNSWLVEVFYSPHMPEAKLPTRNSLWLPRQILTTTDDSIAELHIRNVNYHYLPSQYLGSGLRQTWGAKLSGEQDWGEWTFAHIQGTSSSPTLKIFAELELTELLPNGQGIYELNSDIQLQPLYYDRQTTTFTLQTHFQSSLFRWSSSYSQVSQKNDLLPGWNHSHSLSIEHYFRWEFFDAVAVLQYARGFNQELTDNNITSYDRIFDNTWIFGLRSELNSSLTLWMGHAFEAETKSQFHQLRIVYRFSGKTHFSLASSFIEGPETSILGAFRNNDNLRTQLSFFF